MDIFDKIGKQVTKTYVCATDKTSRIAKETRNKIKISNFKSDIFDVYEEIGRKIYETYILEDEKDISEDLIIECMKIEELNYAIQELENENLDLNNKKKCENCSTKIKDTDNFCFNCGENQNNKQDNNKQENNKYDNENKKEIETIFPEKEIEKSENIVKIESDIDVDDDNDVDNDNELK